MANHLALQGHRVELVESPQRHLAAHSLSSAAWRYDDHAYGGPRAASQNLHFRYARDGDGDPPNDRRRRRSRDSGDQALLAPPPGPRHHADDDLAPIRPPLAPSPRRSHPAPRSPGSTRHYGRDARDRGGWRDDASHARLFPTGPFRPQPAPYANDPDYPHTPASHYYARHDDRYDPRDRFRSSHPASPFALRDDEHRRSYFQD